MNFFDNDVVNNLTSSKQSVPPAPDSPTSLDTPRESSSIASPPMLVSIKRASTSMMGCDDPHTSTAAAIVNQNQEQSLNNSYYAQ